MDRLQVAATVEQCWHDVPGGTATSALRTLDALDQRDSTDVVGVSARHRHPPEHPFVPTIRVRALPLPRALLYESWHRFRRPSVTKAVPEADVIYVTGVAVPPADLPLVVTVHDLAFLHHPGHHTAEGRRFFNRALALTREEASIVVCPSEATRRDCRDAGIDDDRLRVVPWGVDAQPATPDEIAAVRTKFGLAGRFVLFVGTIEPRKNLGTLVAAMESLDDPQVSLVLAGPAGWNEDLAALLADRRVTAKPVGFVPDDELRALFAAAAVFCYPSLLEGFGLPVLEAMAQGTPVVTSSGTATEEILGDGGVAVDPLDAVAVASGLATFLDDEGQAARVGALAAAQASNYTWERTATSIEELLREAGP